MADRRERLDWAERWFSDGFAVIGSTGGFATIDVDVGAARALVDELRRRGLGATLNHVIVRACALALARHPEIHLLAAGTRRLWPEHVDIGLSVAGSGETPFAPVMVIERASAKKLPELVTEVVRRVPEVRARETQDLAWIRRWGWLVPFGFLRRAILRWLQDGLWFRRKVAGTFQVSCLPLDVAVPMKFYTAGLLGVGRARERVVAVDGAPAVRPILTLSCGIDHKIWDGTKVVALFAELKKIIEDDELRAELDQTSNEATTGA